MNDNNWKINPEWEALQDKPHFVPLCCTPEYVKMIEELIREHHLAVEALTEKQLAEAIRQAIACGDFQRYVCASNSSQAVIYIPHAREAYLTGKIRELEEKLSELELVWREQPST